MLTFSNVAALLFSFSLAVNAAPAALPAPDIGTVFAVYPGWDMDNGWSTTTSAVTELACMQSCSASGNCVAYAYTPYEDNFICFLKSSIDLNTFKTQSIDVSVGLIGACGTFAPVGPTQCYSVTA